MDFRIILLNYRKNISKTSRINHEDRSSEGCTEFFVKYTSTTILFYFILFYLILFYFILFYSILSYLIFDQLDLGLS